QIISCMLSALVVESFDKGRRPRQRRQRLSDQTVYPLVRLYPGYAVVASSVTGAFLMISLALVAITRDPYITIVLISIGGFGHQIISCMLSALVVESFDKGQMATVNGMRGSAAWIASFLFSLLIGVTADKIGFNPLFIAMGFFDLIGAIFLVAFIAERRAKRA
ncbi:hypothetical protein UA70_28245, partial [Raoultella planticola]